MINFGECVWCGDDHPLNPVCNDVMGEHISDLEARDDKNYKRIAELEAERNKLREACLTLKNAIMDDGRLVSERVGKAVDKAEEALEAAEIKED